MQIFKDAFKTHREDKEIFMGFGLKHKDDVSDVYVSPYNEGNGHTFIAQSIGEGVNLVLDLLKLSREKNETKSNIWWDPLTTDYTYAEIYPSTKWFEAGVIDERVRSFKVITEKHSGETDGGFMTYSLRINVGCYDEDGKLLPETKNCFQEYYCMLPIFAVLASDYDDSDDGSEPDTSYEQVVARSSNTYFNKPREDNFVKFCEDFYQSNKNNDYYIAYGDVKNKRNLDELSSAFSFIDVFRDVVEKNEKYEQLKIDQFDDEQFLPDYKQLIPILPTELKMDDDLKPIANAIKSGDCISFLQHGESGTGKTINCRLICQAIRLPIMETINCSENLDEFILGKFLPTTNGIEFCESFVTKAIRHGGAVVFEEINFAKPQYLAFLNSLLDDNGFVRLDNNEVVRRHKNFRFFATLNFGYYGTKDLNQALYNRFQLISKTKRICDEKIRNMLLTRIPDCEKYLTKMIKVYNKVAEQIQREELDFVVSPRNLEAWARLAMHIGYAEAAENTIIQVAKGDKSMEKSIRKLINSFRWE